ncbi:hypothetical protein NSA16_08325 [Ligilactobacillus murinus]|nr:hypothetical protein [Ligilactobacillus murinus]
MAIIKGVEHLRIEKQKRQKAESIKESKKEVKDQAKARQKIALWVVQHFEGAEPIKEIKVGKIKSYGILGSGGSAVSVMINNNERYIIDGISVREDGDVIGGAIYDDSKLKYMHVPNKKRDLSEILVKYWEE